MNDVTKVTIDVRNVIKRYGDFTALHKISMSIMDNEFFTLLGPSGCGKTTLLKMIAGFEDVTEGAIFLSGEEIGSLPPNRRPVNTVFQNYALFPHMTVLENIGFGLEMRGSSRKDAETRAGEMLELVQLSSFAKRKPSQLSGGQQQRVALARALAPSPKVLLLDEPLSALDLKLRQSMQVELKQIQRETGITFIFVTHDQEEALTMSDRIAVMNAGELQQLGSPREIYEQPQNMFVADFIGDSNLLSVSIDSVTEGLMKCHIGGGHFLIIDEASAVGVGDKVHLSVRPERLLLSDEAAETNSLKGTVLQSIYKGTDISTTVELAGGPIISVRTSNTARGIKRLMPPGSAAFVNMEAGAARLLAD